MDYWKSWAKAALIRALKTACQTAIGVIGAATIMSELDWLTVGSAALLAAIVSILTSLAGLPEVDAAVDTSDVAAAHSEPLDGGNDED
jgi:hypothetical protein